MSYEFTVNAVSKPADCPWQFTAYTNIAPTPGLRFESHRRYFNVVRVLEFDEGTEVYAESLAVGRLDYLPSVADGVCAYLGTISPYRSGWLPWFDQDAYDAAVQSVVDHVGELPSDGAPSVDWSIRMRELGREIYAVTGGDRDREIASTMLYQAESFLLLTHPRRDWSPRLFDEHWDGIGGRFAPTTPHLTWDDADRPTSSDRSGVSPCS